MQQRLVVDRPGWDSETTWHLSWFHQPAWGESSLGGTLGSRSCQESLPSSVPLWGAETSLASPSPPGHLVDSWGPCTCVLSMPSLRSRTRLCPCTDVALGAEPWLVTSLEPRDLAQASRCHWRQEPWDRVWEGLPGAELLCEDPWGPQARVFPESCRVFLRVLVTERGQGAGLRVLSLC